MSKPQLQPDFHYDLRSRDASRILMVGTLASSMVYQLFVFAVAAMFGYRVALALAILTAGVTYLSFLAQLAPHRVTVGVMQLLVALSIGLGALAGGAVVVNLLLG